MFVKLENVVARFALARFERSGIFLVPQLFNVVGYIIEGGRRCIVSAILHE
jgi:hypothetical protein